MPKVYWFSDRYKLCFFGIPKNASTSIRYFLNIKPNVGYYDTDGKDVTDYKKFTVIRNPLTRIISSYNEILKMRYDTEESNEITKSLPFYRIQDKQQRFEQFIVDIKDNLYDIHLTPQIDYIRNVPIDFYLRFEQLQKDMERYLGLVNKMFVLNSTEKNIYEDINITKDIEQQIIEIYKEDFELYEDINK
jgi:hypothetical protein